MAPLLQALRPNLPCEQVSLGGICGSPLTLFLGSEVAGRGKVAPRANPPRGQASLRAFEVGSRAFRCASRIARQSWPSLFRGSSTISLTSWTLRFINFSVSSNCLRVRLWSGRPIDSRSHPRVQAQLLSHLAPKESSQTVYGLLLALFFVA